MIINDKRELAYVVEIKDLVPIEGADNIMLTYIGGWSVVVKKNEFTIGDKAVYFEIDSKLPDTDERFAFLAPKNYKVKTMKLNKFKVFSQGLVMPLSLFPELGDLALETPVTDALGITYAVAEDNERKTNKVDKNKKYQSMISRHSNLFKKPLFRWLLHREWGRKLLFIFFGKKKDNPRGWPVGKFPSVNRTDEERAENLASVVLGYPNPLIVTEKLDGTSSTYILERKGRKRFEFYVLSRNVRLTDEHQECYHDHNIYWDMAFKYQIEDKLRKYLMEYPDMSYVCIQGESVGNVQGNPLKLKEDDLYVFNFIDSQYGRYPSNIAKQIVEEMDMKFVPILDYNFKMPTDMETFKELADGYSVINPKVLREGLVLRDPSNNFSFKNVSRKYLLKHNL